jgi:hypothetical protein
MKIEIQWDGDAPLDPYEIKPYPVDWTKALAVLGETIKAAEFTLPDNAVTAGLQIESQMATDKASQAVFSIAEAHQTDSAWAAGVEFKVRATVWTEEWKYSGTCSLMVKVA